ncbi:MAG: GNAT family N-acetyltransferase [Alphaproteobacteria bacterium]|nr:MAG: GNAT family N-acetyltransferase [Alphaproteobacteria bacterium]
MSAALTITPVTSRRDHRAFVTLPRRIFADDPHWVPPFSPEVNERLDRDKNPYFDHAEMMRWLAWRGDEPVGRISAQIDQVALAHQDGNTGHFGFFDVIDDAEVAEALLSTAEDWLRAHGITTVLGPYNPTISEEPGILVDGFDAPPMMLMGHSRPYYQRLVEANGYVKAKDLYAYHLDIRNEILPAGLKRLTERFRGEGKLMLRNVRMNHYDEDLAIILDIFNDAWSANWGFLPMTDAELKHTADGLKILVKPEMSMIAEWQGKPIAMMVTLPNINEILKAIDGRLLPFGWVRLLWWLKVGPIRTVRVPLMGVLKEHQSSALGAAASLSLIETIRTSAAANGVCFAELSWILDDNMPMRGILEKIGSRLYKTYRVYTKSLS